jgi:hypothetical protein
MGKSFAIVLLLLLISSVSLADSLDSTDQTRQLADKMINHFAKKEFQEGLALAKPHWPLPEVEIDGLANQIATQWPMVDQRFGISTGKEFIREERIGKSFIRYYYLHKFQNHAIYWLFTFYRPSDKWKVNGVTFKDDLESLFKTVE